MDAKEQLRLYLEQRREAGERDLVLDHLDVDAVLALIGAKLGAPRASAGATGDVAPVADDWRQVLRGSGASP